MSLTDFKNTVVFSVSRSYRCPLVNRKMIDDTTAYLQNSVAHVVNVTGCYQGVLEDSYIVNGRDIHTARMLGYAYDQDCIMVINDKLECHLHFMGGMQPITFIGIWTQVDSPTGLEAYTIIQGNIYTAIMPRE